MKLVEVADYTKLHRPSQYHLQEKEGELAVHVLICGTLSVATRINPNAGV